MNNINPKKNPVPLIIGQITNKVTENLLKIIEIITNKTEGMKNINVAIIHKYFIILLVWLVFLLNFFFFLAISFFGFLKYLKVLTLRSA